MVNELGNLFSDIARAIRGKTGDTGTIKPIEFPEAIEAIETGGADAPELLENVPITPDFSGGDQYFAAPAGMAVQSAIILQPSNLIPENIAEGVNIAGIIGTLVAGGGDDSGGLKITCGKFTPTGQGATINHNLGVVPDIAAIFCTGDAKDGIVYQINFSARVFAAFPSLISRFVSNLSKQSGGAAFPLDGPDTYNYGFLSGATRTTMSISSTGLMHKLSTSHEYFWFVAAMG
jgi:hypothetical protein